MIVNLGLVQNMREKRLTPRKAVSARVRISHSTFGVINTRTQNISDTGVYLHLVNQPHLPIGAHIKMHMIDSAMPEIAFNMKVVRTDEQGISLVFVDYEVHGERYPIDSLQQVWRQQSQIWR